jgi:hypothetical protein
METFYPKSVEDLREFIEGKWHSQVHVFLHGECIGQLADETCLLTNNQITLMLRDSSGESAKSHVFLESRLRAYKFQFAE